MDTYTLESPGKINLYLEVRGKRADLWHELLTLFYPVRSLSDRVGLRFGGDGIRIRCSLPGVPVNEDNLAAKAARAFYAEHPTRKEIKFDVVTVVTDGEVVVSVTYLPDAFDALG